MPALRRPFRQLSLGIVTMLGMTFLLSLLLIFFDLKDRLEQRFIAYESLLDMFSAVYVPDLTNGYQWQLDALGSQLDLARVRHGQAPLSNAWALLYSSSPNKSHFYFYNPRYNRVDAYPRWVPPPGYQPQQRPWARYVDPALPEPRWVGPYTEIDRGEPVMTAVRRVRDQDGRVLGLLLVDMPLDPLQQVLERVAGRHPIALQVYDRDSKTLVASVNGSGATVNAFRLGLASNTLHVLPVLQNGLLLYRRLGTPHWDVVLYLPPEQVWSIMTDAAPRYLIPLFGLLLFWLLGLLLLRRILQREQQLLSDEMGRLVQEERWQHPLQTRSERLWFVGEQLGVVQRVARKLDEANRASNEDVLTGMPNRRAFMLDLAGRWQAGQAFWLLAIDIDHFKQLNDRYGHLFGDSVLQRLSATLAGSHWPLTLYRTGGDELLALVDAGVDMAALLDDLLQRVRGLAWREAGAVVSVSIGAACRSEADDSDALLALADARLYASKRERNRACYRDEAAAPAPGA